MSFVIPSSWELASLLCKLALYAGLCALAGTFLNLAFYNDGSRRTMQCLLLYGLIGCVIGFQGVLFNYLVQVGMISSNGLAGMFDLGMIQLLLDTPQGESTVWRLLGFTLALISLGWGLQRIAALNQPPGQQLMRVILVPQLLALIILAGTFQMSGHVAVLDRSGQLAIALHVLAFSSWIGSLLPLYWLTRRLEATELQGFMKRFGDHARLILGVLLVAGGLLVWQLLASPAELLQTAYGQSLSLKLLLVLGLMGIAAANRYTLVPALTEKGVNEIGLNEIGVTEKGLGHASVGSVPNPANKLATAIRFEALLALLILITTAYLSTLIGPVSHA